MLLIMTTNVTILPNTQIVSWTEFNQTGQKKSIKNKVLHVLTSYSQGFTRPELAELLQVKENCLTACLRESVNNGVLFISGVRYNTSTSRHNQVYKLVR
jgi:hypothetical protein